nr:collagen alpha-1(III) chain-like [Vulpes vulpes]
MAGCPSQARRSWSAATTCTQEEQSPGLGLLCPPARPGSVHPPPRRASKASGSVCTPPSTEPPPQPPLSGPQREPGFGTRRERACGGGRALAPRSLDEDEATRPAEAARAWGSGAQAAQASHRPCRATGESHREDTCTGLLERRTLPPWKEPSLPPVYCPDMSGGASDFAVPCPPVFWVGLSGEASFPASPLGCFHGGPAWAPLGGPHGGSQQLTGELRGPARRAGELPPSHRRGDDSSAAFASQASPKFPHPFCSRPPSAKASSASVCVDQPGQDGAEARSTRAVLRGRRDGLGAPAGHGPPLWGAPLPPGPCEGLLRASTGQQPGLPGPDPGLG